MGAAMDGRFLFLGGSLDGRRIRVAPAARLWSRIARNELVPETAGEITLCLDAETYHRVSVPPRLTDAALTRPLGIAFYRHFALTDLEALAKLVEGYPEPAVCAESCQS